MNAVVVQLDGRVIIGGEFTALTVQADSKVFIGGYSVHYDCIDEGCIAYDGYFVVRLLAKGSRDTNESAVVAERSAGALQIVCALWSAVASEARHRFG